MTQCIPRPLVAQALSVDEASLPEGDLPLSRLATRLLMFLRDTVEDEEAVEGHPELWTALLATRIAERNPSMSLSLQCRLMAEAQDAEDLAVIAEGPLTELFALQGTTLLTEIEDLARTAPRFAQAISLLPAEAGGALFRARLSALAKPLDELAPPDGLT